VPILCQFRGVDNVEYRTSIEHVLGSGFTLSVDLLGFSGGSCDNQKVACSCAGAD
jgi:hypothetical protein